VRLSAGVLDEPVRNQLSISNRSSVSNHGLIAEYETRNPGPVPDHVLEVQFVYSDPNGRNIYTRPRTVVYYAQTVRNHLIRQRSKKKADTFELPDILPSVPI